MDRRKEHLMSWYDPSSWDWTGGQVANNIDPNSQIAQNTTTQLGQIANTAQSRAAPTMSAAQLATGNIDQSRGGMMRVAGNLGAIASGANAGAGELAVNRGISSANAAQMSAARNVRGANAALAYRNAARNTADIGLAGAGQAAQAQMSDQQAANAQLGQIYGNMYGQDASVAGQNATLAQQAASANQQSAITTRAQNDALQIQALGQQLGWDQTRINAEIAKAQANAQDKGILGGLLQAGGQIGAAYATGKAGAPGAP
jgi:hypothetical protein